MTESAGKQIEIEFRAIFEQNKYKKLKEFLDKNARDLGRDDKDVHFFIMDNKLLKVVNNISQGDAKIVMKLSKIGKGSDFEEIELPIRQADVGKAVKTFTALGITNNIMHSFQKRHNYLYKDVELALKHSDVWGYHLELEIMVDDKNKKEEAERQIQETANELGVRLMTDKEFIEFTKNAEAKYKEEKISKLA